jgi:hypothetical protein
MNVLAWGMFTTLCLLLYLQYRKTGVLFTPGSSWLFSFILLPVYVAYPFATTPESLSNIGQNAHFRTIQWGVDEVLVVVTVGTISGVISYWLAARFLAEWLARFAKRTPPARLSGASVTLGACLTSLLSILFIWGYFYYAGFVPLFDDPATRFLATRLAGGQFYEAAYTIANVGMIYLLGALTLRKVSSYRLLTVLMILMTSFSNLATASRGNFLSPFVMVGFIYFSAKGKSEKLTPVRALALATGLLLLAGSLQLLRYHAAFSWEALEDEILHGNTFFANLRDTGWVVSSFHMRDHDLFYGKTILAGFLGLMPRDFHFRAEYRWGAAALRIVEARDPEGYFGLAHVLFGDWYLNFGYPGVIVEGVILGLLMRLLDARLLEIRSRARTLSEYDYRTAFKIWFASLLISFFFSSALTPYAYSYLAGYVALFSLAAMMQTIFFRGRTPDARWLPPAHGLWHLQWNTEESIEGKLPRLEVADHRRKSQGLRDKGLYSVSRGDKRS